MKDAGVAHLAMVFWMLGWSSAVLCHTNIARWVLFFPGQNVLVSLPMYKTRCQGKGPTASCSVGTILYSASLGIPSILWGEPRGLSLTFLCPYSLGQSLVNWIYSSTPLVEVQQICSIMSDSVVDS